MLDLVAPLGLNGKQALLFAPDLLGDPPGEGDPLLGRERLDAAVVLPKFGPASTVVERGVGQAAALVAGYHTGGFHGRCNEAAELLLAEHIGGETAVAPVDEEIEEEGAGGGTHYTVGHVVEDRHGVLQILLDYGPGGIRAQF